MSAADDRPSSIAGSECRKSFSSESDARTLSVSERSETGSVQEIPKCEFVFVFQVSKFCEKCLL